LRSGCYVTQDGAFYQEASPLAGRRDGHAVVHDAIELWSVVLSGPERGRAICSMGERDVSHDMGLPVPMMSACRGGDPMRLDGAAVVALSDQHGHLAVVRSCPLGPGDLVGCAIAHPCATFDKWRFIPIVDDGYVIVDAIATQF
jgi:D-serine dehydratase